MTSPRRILHVVHGYPPESAGGTEAHVRDLLDAQPALGLDVALLHGSFEPRGTVRVEPRSDLDVPAFRLHRADHYSDFWDKAHCPPATEQFRDLLRSLRPDLVHVHQWIRLTDDLVATAEDAGIATVVSLHDLYSSCPACFRQRPNDEHCERVVSFESCHDCVPLRGHESREEVELGIRDYRAAFRNELLSARRVLAATRATAELVTRGLELPGDLVTILPLGYRRRFGDRERRSAAKAPLRVAYWGHVTRRKGVQVLLDGVRALAAERELDGVLEVHVFGRIDTDELEGELDRRARGLPVVFHGRYDYSQLAGAGIGLAAFPSTCFETYGFVLDEAFELGVPALVTDAGAFAERLAGAGFLVPPGDSAAVAATLRDVLDAPSKLDEAAARVPDPGPDPAEHARLLLDEYARAAATPRRATNEIDLEVRRRLERLRARGDRDTAPLQRGLGASSTP